MVEDLKGNHSESQCHACVMCIVAMQLSIMVDHRSSFVIVLWISLLSFSLHEGRCRPKEGSHKNGVAASSLNFMVVGDWGGQDDPPYYTNPEQDVAKQMGDIAASMGAQFTLSMGDNFYDNGVTDVDDPRFKDTFEVHKHNVYTRLLYQ